jgi:hypothetical protein
VSEIKIIKPVNIKVSELHHRYLPKITPMHIIGYRRDPMHISRSPHVKLLRTMVKYGFNKRKLKQTKYFQERRHRYALGMPRWTDSWIFEHIKVRWRIFKSLEKNGYDKRKAKSRPVIVLAKPLIETRFNWSSGFLSGPEIYDGFGRSSSAFVLGIKTIPGVLAIDNKPGACEFSKGYDKIKRYKK